MSYNKMERTLTEKIADYIENPRKAEAEELREDGLPKYLTTKTLSFPVEVGVNAIGLGVAIGAAALVGEAMDHAPYISTAVPEAIEQLTRSEYFHGNLDKLGAALGFIGHYLRKK
jgi:hypothetical protein